MNNRRRLVLALGSAVSIPRDVFAQAKKPPVVIGWLSLGSPEPSSQTLVAFKEGFAAQGWKEGTQYVIEARWAEGEFERLPVLAAELAKRKPAVVIVPAVTLSHHMVKTAPDIPIVQVGGVSPVQAGLAQTLARPGGMVTGITQLPRELSEKMIELLVEVAPKVRRVGVLIGGNVKDRSVWLDPIRRSAAHYGVEVYFAYPIKIDEIEMAIADLAKQGAQALVANPSPFLQTQRDRIIALAQAHRWPLVSWARNWVEQGALLSYGVDFEQNYRRAAYFVDRILKGTKPGDLPIEQPMNFELAVNMKSAKALGLTIPPTIAVRATHVIQ